MSASLGVQKSGAGPFVVWCSVGAGFCLLVALVYWLATRTESEAVERLTRQSFFAALQDHDATIFENAKRRMMSRLNEGKTDVAPVAAAVIDDVLEKYAPCAADDAIVEFARCRSDLVTAMRVRGAQKSTGGAKTANGALFDGCTEEDATRLMNALGDLVKTGAGHAPITISRTSVQLVAEKYRSDDMTAVMRLMDQVAEARPGGDRDIAAAHLLEGIQATLTKLPTSEAAMLLRYAASLSK